MDSDEIKDFSTFSDQFTISGQILGAGAYGKVVKAKQKITGNEVAVKFETGKMYLIKEYKVLKSQLFSIGNQLSCLSFIILDLRTARTAVWKPAYSIDVWIWDFWQHIMDGHGIAWSVDWGYSR